MAIAPHTISDLEEHEERVGHPSDPLPLAVRDAYSTAGLTVPVTRKMLSIIAPPLPGSRSGVGGCCFDTPEPCGGHCHVCGASTTKTQNRAACAVAAYEETTHPESGDKIRFLVTHCDEHAPKWYGGPGMAHCSATAATPGSGITDGPGGYCEPLSTVETAGVEILPGARYVGRFMKFALTSLGVFVPAWLVSQLAIQTSQGQQQGNLGGGVANLIVPGNATSGNGFNVGGLRVLSGAAPATANAAETGTIGIAWVMPATAFQAATAAIPSVAVANAISNVNASNTITAGYGRLVENADTGFGISTTLRRFQFAVGTSGSDLNMNTLSVVVGGAASCTSLSLTHGA